MKSGKWDNALGGFLLGIMTVGYMYVAFWCSVWL